MKALLNLTALFVLLISAEAFAKDKCANAVNAYYSEALYQYDYHSIALEGLVIPANTLTFESYGQSIALGYKALGYDFDVLVYEASSEYMGGYGVDAIFVNPSNCEVLKMINVYEE